MVSVQSPLRNWIVSTALLSNRNKKAIDRLYQQAADRCANKVRFK